MKTQLHSTLDIRPSSFPALGAALLAASLLCTALAPGARAQYPAPDDFYAGVSGPGDSTVVNSLAVQPDGKILVGGLFDTLGGQPRSHIGRLNADGTLDQAFAPGANGLVYSMALQTDGKILVGGDFEKLNGLSVGQPGRLNADGTLDGGFISVGSTHVYSLAMQADGKILVGGYFSTMCGQPRNYLARVNADGTLDAAFDPEPDNIVFSLAVQPDGKILVGGYFLAMGGQPCTNFARLNVNGTLDSGFNPGAIGFVFSIAVQADGKILVGGSGMGLGGQWREGLGRVNADGTLDASFDPRAYGYPPLLPGVYSLALQTDGKILLGGTFTSLCGQARNFIGRLNADGTLDTSFNPAPGPGSTNGIVGGVHSLAVQADGKILVGGWFTTLGGQTREVLGRLNATGPATQSLSSDDSTITWLRGGTSPEVWRTTFEHSPDGLTWTSLGAGARIPGGWQLAGPYLPPGGTISARGSAVGGCYHGTSVFVETTLTAQLYTIIHNGAITVTGYSGPGGAVTTPNKIDSLPVTAIGDSAFLNFTNLTSVIIPSSVTNIGARAFSGCYRLTGAYFKGDAVNLDVAPDAFQGATDATVYYLPGKTGWGLALGGRPTALWRPRVPTRDPGFGVRTKQFGFNISWAEGMTVVVEACTNLADPAWSPLQTNTMAVDCIHFSDPPWTNYDARNYRVRAQ